MYYPFSPEDMSGMQGYQPPENNEAPPIGPYHYVPQGTGLNHLLTSSGTVPSGTVSGTTLSGSTVQHWLTTLENQSKKVTPVAHDSVDFWYVAQMAGDDYADDLVEHPEIPMMIPKKGKFLGIARTKEEMEKLASDWQTKQPSTSADNRYVHLVYKIRMRGIDQMIEALEFFHSKGMLEKQD